MIFTKPNHARRERLIGVQHGAFHMFDGLSSEQVVEIVSRSVSTSGHVGIEIRVDCDLGRVDDEVINPDQTCFLAEVSEPLKEAREGCHPQSLPDASETGVVRQWSSNAQPRESAVRQMEAGSLDEIEFSTDAFEEHDQLELEEDH